jgi:hypothetical protein
MQSLADEWRVRALLSFREPGISCQSGVGGARIDGAAAVAGTCDLQNWDDLFIPSAGESPNHIGRSPTADQPRRRSLAARGYRGRTDGRAESVVLWHRLAPRDGLSGRPTGRRDSTTSMIWCKLTKDDTLLPNYPGARSVYKTAEVTNRVVSLPKFLVWINKEPAIANGFSNWLLTDRAAIPATEMQAMSTWSSR